jgi:hypothetical protein
MYRTANHTKEFFMKNLYKLLGIAVLAMAIVFSFAACDNSTSSGGGGGGGGTSYSTNGELTITGLSAYEGKYIFGTGIDSSNNGYYVASSISSTEVKFGKVASGNVTLKVYKITSSGYGNIDAGAVVTLSLIVTTTEKVTPDNVGSVTSTTQGSGTGSVTFTNVKTTIAKTESGWTWN